MEAGIKTFKAAPENDENDTKTGGSPTPAVHVPSVGSILSANFVNKLKHACQRWQIIALLSVVLLLSETQPPSPSHD